MNLTLVLSAYQAFILLPAWPYLQATWELPLCQHFQLPLPQPPITALADCMPAENFDGWTNGCFQFRHGAGMGLPSSQALFGSF